MTDVLSPKRRRHNMSQIRSRDTKPEMIIRRGLHARGFRFRLHGANLPGRPDLVFPGRRAVIFVHGCFWHGHCCHMFRWPRTREEFWRDKIEKNRARDQWCTMTLRERGWRVLTVWECAIRGPGRFGLDDLLTSCATFLATSDHFQSELKGSLPSAVDD